MSRVPGLAAVVLCGGESSRMGRPKAFLPFGGEPLLARVARRLAEVASPIVVVAAPDQALPPLPEHIVIARDAVAGRGPLQGLLAGLDALDPGERAAFVTSTDAPFLSPAFVRRMETLRSEGEYDAAVPEVEGRRHPLAAVYALSVRGRIAGMLAQDQLRLRAIFDRLRARVVTAEELLADPDLARADPDLASLRNLNTPEDYRAALSEAGFDDAPDPVRNE